MHPGEQMARKLNLAGAIILIPTLGGKQIAFAVLISSFCLYVSLRLNPYVDDKLEKLHIISLTAQCITLFYALLLELQNVTNSDLLDCSSGTCERALSDLVMDYMLTFMQISIFILPAYLFAKSWGLFEALGARMQRALERIRDQMGFSSSEGRHRWPPLQALRENPGPVAAADEEHDSETRESDGKHRTPTAADAICIEVDDGPSSSCPQTCVDPVATMEVDSSVCFRDTSFYPGSSRFRGEGVSLTQPGNLISSTREHDVGSVDLSQSQQAAPAYSRGFSCEVTNTPPPFLWSPTGSFLNSRLSMVSPGSRLSSLVLALLSKESDDDDAGREFALSSQTAMQLSDGTAPIQSAADIGEMRAISGGCGDKMMTPPGNLDVELLAIEAEEQRLRELAKDEEQRLLAEEQRLKERIEAEEQMLRDRKLAVLRQRNKGGVQQKDSTLSGENATSNEMVSGKEK